MLKIAPATDAVSGHSSSQLLASLTLKFTLSPPLHSDLPLCECAHVGPLFQQSLLVGAVMSLYQPQV